MVRNSSCTVRAGSFGQYRPCSAVERRRHARAEFLQVGQSESGCQRWKYLLPRIWQPSARPGSTMWPPHRRCPQIPLPDCRLGFLEDRRRRPVFTTMLHMTGRSMRRRLRREVVWQEGPVLRIGSDETTADYDQGIDFGDTKYASYSFAAGPGGTGPNDYYSPEVDSIVMPLPAVQTAEGADDTTGPSVICWT